MGAIINGEHYQTGEEKISWEATMMANFQNFVLRPVFESSPKFILFFDFFEILRKSTFLKIGFRGFKTFKPVQLITNLIKILV